MHIHHVGVGVKGIVPHVIDDCFTSENTAPVAQEEFKDGELFSGEIDHVPGAGTQAGAGVKNEIGDLMEERFQIRRATEEGADTREEFREGERLNKVVVRPGVQAGDAVADRVAGSEHENGDADAVRPQAAAEIEAGKPGEQDVEDNEVEVGAGEEVERFGTVGSEINSVVGLAEAAGKEIGDVGFIFNNEQTHGALPLLIMARRR